MHPGDLKPMKGADFYGKKIDFEPPIPSLPRLTIKFKMYGGDIVTTAETNGVDTVQIIFEVTTRSRRVV
jgi:hypothetical protein